MPLAQLAVPFDHPDWIFEPKWDGWRALAYVEPGRCQLVSRKGNRLKSFPGLCAAIAVGIRGPAVLDGEVVHLGTDGKPQFYDLMRRRSPQHFYAFDLLWLGGQDLRTLPLIERKRRLRSLIPAAPGPALFTDHVAGAGVELFRAVCDGDMEGVVAKLASGLYEPEATTWVKIKNRSYSQAEGRADFFDERRAAMHDFASEGDIDREKVRERLRKMSDDALKRFGAAARYMSSPKAHQGKPPRNFVIQLEEALAEWRRRTSGTNGTAR